MTKPRKRIIEGSPVSELLGELDAPEQNEKRTNAERIPRNRRGDAEGTPSRAPAGYKLDPRYIETKTARLQLVLKPSVADKLKAYCKARKISVNDFVGTIIEERLNDGK